MKRVALVTGGARGIGFGISEALAREGFDLVICGQREAEAVREPLTALEGLGVEAHYVQADVSYAAARARLAKPASSARVDIIPICFNMRVSLP